MTVNELRKALPLDGTLEVRLTMTVYKGGDFFVSPIVGVERNSTDYGDDGIERFYLMGVPEGEEE